MLKQGVGRNRMELIEKICQVNNLLIFGKKPIEPEGVS